MNKELNQIKKIYGEEMMHLCRELFPTILEQEGLLLRILTNNIAPTHSLAIDIKENKLYEEFKSYVYSFIEVEKVRDVYQDKTPFQLMNKAGYNLYECKSEDDIQSFRKYYEPSEVLCTINNGGRLERCYVFFAVKKNVDQIKRKDFKNPKREDEYGTSVISIQFSRGKTNTISIKNRYNHTVNNPDATFSNNLDNIILGLKNSFENYYGFHINQNERSEAGFLTDILKYTRGKDGRYYRYNLEIDGVYYCENNIIIKDGEVITKYRDNKERYLLIDEFIIDRKDKTIYSCATDDDSFVQSIKEVGLIESINVTKNNENRNIDICYDEGKQVRIVIDKNNNIIEYDNNYILKIGDEFLRNNQHLKSISLSQARIIGDRFLFDNTVLNYISLPQAKVIGYFFLQNNIELTSISLPQARTIASCFLRNNRKLENISLPNAQEIGYNFLYCNQKLRSISLPQAQIIRDDCLFSNMQLTYISLPYAQEIGNNFLVNNYDLEYIEAPLVKTIGNSFLFNNQGLKIIELPLVETIGFHFLAGNKQLKDMSAPLIRSIGISSLFYSEKVFKKIWKQITINTATEKVLKKVI